MTRQIRLIADDYGLAPGVCDAILELLERERLTGTGCMTGSPEWQQAAVRIKPLIGRVAVGLHLTLTDQPALSADSSLVSSGRLPPLRDLAAPFKRRRIKAGDVHAELDAQLRRFVDTLGCTPDFIDGHQHVHFLPVVRDWLKVRFAASEKPALRGAPVVPLEVGAIAVKTAVIAALARGFDRTMQAAGFPMLKPLAGIYDWKRPEDFAPTLRAAVVTLPEDGVFMCHPGHVDAELVSRDPMQKVREVEYAFLMSNEFGAILAAHDAVVRSGVS
ncbi:ChbG/HpnK family deacetylase [Mesorhizobium sp. NPDC059054]|uniref:ChbG/HpnK family deacetylase n=1 Tax=Mesorhizobium sp. NPDC059054 TaxID=3346711 RepID=UPI0036C3E990